jgi:transposase InsO family protein
MQHRDLSERHGLRIMGMSASALRYRPQPERNATLRTQIVQLAQRHRRYGAEMIQLKLRQAGWKVNHKRVERLYSWSSFRCAAAAQEGTGRRATAAITAADGQPGVVDGLCVRPGRGWTINQMPGDRRRRTHEAVAIVPEHSIGGEHLTRLLDQVRAQRGKPAIIRSDNGREFTGKASFNWAYRNEVALKLIEPASRIRMRMSSRSMAVGETSA